MRILNVILHPRSIANRVQEGRTTHPDDADQVYLVVPAPEVDRQKLPIARPKDSESHAAGVVELHIESITLRRHSKW